MNIQYKVSDIARELGMESMIAPKFATEHSAAIDLHYVNIDDAYEAVVNAAGIPSMAVPYGREELLQKEAQPYLTYYMTKLCGPASLVESNNVTPCAAPRLFLGPGDFIRIDTGLRVWIGSENDNYAGLIIPRSGLGSKQGLVLRNLVGLIDADYQGKLLVTLHNTGREVVLIEREQRIAQLMIVPIVRPTYTKVEEFDGVTTRADGGFGSTGV